MQKKLVGLVLPLSVVMAVLRTVLINSKMEKAQAFSDYYLPKTFSTNAFTVGAFACIGLFAVLALLACKGKRAVPDKKNSTVSAASCMLAFIQFGTVIIFVITYAASPFEITGLQFITLLLSVLSGGVFLASAVKFFNEKVLAAFALCPMFLSVFRLLHDFISTNAAPLANSGAYHITGLVALMLFFLCLGKAYVSKGSAALYYFFGYIAVFLLLVYAVPDLILNCFVVSFSFGYESALSVADIVIAVYICTNLATTDLVVAKKEESKA